MLTYVNSLFMINQVVADVGKRNRHPDKHIEAAIVYAESLGWEFRESGGSSHAWGKLFCPLHTRDGHHLSIYTTPSNPFRYAQLICQRINKCEHDRELKL